MQIQIKQEAAVQRQPVLIKPQFLHALKLRFWCFACFVCMSVAFVCVCMCECVHAVVNTGYGQDLTGFGHSFADPTQQTASYAAPTAQPSAGPQPAASSFARGQNHNVQGFHPYRR